jgi:cyclophilin family peptidyl-prolyl cis-trans isomerase/HEAT repeat protein
MRPGSYLFLLVGLVYCTPKEPINRFADIHLLRIAEYQDRRQSDSLLLYLQHPNANYRQAAARAFGSVQDSTVSPLLGSLLLEDPEINVRIAAAFALGQTGGTQATNALIPSLSDTSARVRKEALEALGKSIRKEDLPTIHQYEAKDSISSEGLAWSLYRIGLRNLADTLVTKKASGLLKASSTATALGAAHFFARSNYPLIPEVEAVLLTATKSNSADIRMAAAYALRKFPTQAAFARILEILSQEQDYRVRTNAARTLRFFPWAMSKDAFAKALADTNVNVAIFAAEGLLAAAFPESLSSVYEWAKTAANARVKAHLYEAGLLLNPDEKTTQEIFELYKQSTSDYQKAWWLKTLSRSPHAWDFILNELRSAKSKVISTNAAAALLELDRGPAFKADLKRRRKTIEQYREVLQSADPGIVFSICEALKDPDLRYKEIVDDYSFLNTIKQSLSLPRDFEALQPLEETIAYFQGVAYAPPPKTFNHPIVWDSLRTIPKDQRVRIETTKGVVELVLFVNEAPGSVLNFIQLTKAHYFDNLFFHRVVPNFVVQAGCHRGDGLGSEDYSIRSEFSGRKYKTGSLGMASAGKDTEGTQWFITHSPTPHLDGAYTVFGEVAAGQEIVDQLEVGDQILRATLVKK